MAATYSLTGSIAYPILVTSTASTSGQYLSLRVNGTLYKVDLLSV